MQLKNYEIIRKFFFHFFGKRFEFAYRRRVNLNKAIQFIFDKGIATPNSRIEDVKIMLEAGADFCSWNYDVQKAKK